MLKRNMLLVAGLAAVLSVASAVSSQAITIGPLSNINHLTFSQPVRLPGVLLPAGSYEFELGPAGTHRDIVRVSDVHGRPYYMGFTQEVARPSGSTNKRVIDFGEAVAGSPMPIAVWYPVDSSTGHAFVYR
jgi:hypothetical protein